MKKFAPAVLVLMLVLLITTFVVGNRAMAVVDFDAYAGTAIPDSLIDGTIGTEWNDSGHYTNVLINPGGTAEIWTKNDGAYLYMAIQFTADSNNPWLALQLGTTGCMDLGADGAIFGNDNLVPNGYNDAHFGGVGIVTADTIQNGAGTMNISAGNLVTVELKKPLNSGDTAGKDIAWAQGNTYSLVIAWDSNGGGSSGGTTNHSSGGPTARGILIDPNAKPGNITPVGPSLRINVSSPVYQNEEFQVSVTLQNSSDVPVPNATVTFYMNTTFGGRIDIGSVLTDSIGQASLGYTIRVVGSYRFEAIFGGSIQGSYEFKPSNASATVVVEPRETAPIWSPKDPFYNWGIFILNRPQANPPLGFGLAENVMALGILSLFYLLILSVYATLLYVISLFYRIAQGEKKKK